MTLSQITTIYLTALPYITLAAYQYLGFEITIFLREVALLYTINIFNFICGSQWSLSGQTLSSSTKIAPLLFVIAGTISMLIISHGEFISAALLLSILYILQLGYDLSSEIAYCSQRSYKIARIISTAVVLYALGFLIV